MATGCYNVFCSTLCLLHTNILKTYLHSSRLQYDPVFYCDFSLAYKTTCLAAASVFKMVELLTQLLVTFLTTYLVYKFLKTTMFGKMNLKSIVNITANQRHLFLNE